jgi:hypothetical protein
MHENLDAGSTWESPETFFRQPGAVATHWDDQNLVGFGSSREQRAALFGTLNPESSAYFGLIAWMNRAW